MERFLYLTVYFALTNGAQILLMAMFMPFTWKAPTRKEERNALRQDPL